MLFGDFLLCIKNTKVTEENIITALKKQEELHEKGENKKLGMILIDMGVITHDDLNKYLDLREAVNKIDFSRYLMRMNEKE